MNKNLLKVSASVLLASMVLVGCGGSSKDKKVEDKNGSETPTPTPTPIVDVKNCTYTVAGKTSFVIGDTFTNDLLNVTVKNGKGEALTSGTKYEGTVDTTKEGSNTVKVSNDSCSTMKDVEVKVNKKSVFGDEDTSPIASPF